MRSFFASFRRRIMTYARSAAIDKNDSVHNLCNVGTGTRFHRGSISSGVNAQTVVTSRSSDGNTTICSMYCRSSSLSFSIMNKKLQTQKTPKEKYEIPIPKRGDVLKVFKKAATHKARSASRSPKK